MTRARPLALFNLALFALAFFTLALFVLLAWPAGPAVAAEAVSTPRQPVLLKARVLVDDEVIRLGDIFDGTAELSEATVSRAPAPGRRVQVDARWLRAVAQAYALPWRPRSRFDTLTIERQSQVIEATQLEAAALEALAARGVTGRISVALDNPALRLHLPTGVSPSLAVTGLSYDPKSGRFSAQVLAPDDATPLVRATLSGRAVEMTEVPALTRRVEPGEVIGRQDLQWISVPVDRVTRNTLADESRLLGKSPRRPIRAGRAILGSDLREPIVVEKNSIVTIRLETPHMVLTAQGRSLDQGADGDVIRVMNTKSKKIINATVQSNGEVRVALTTVASRGQEVLQ